MRKIFESIGFTQIGFYQAILESNGFPPEIRNAVSSSAMGAVRSGPTPSITFIARNDRGMVPR